VIGAPDFTFLANTGTGPLNGFSSYVYALAIDLAGNIIVGGQFTSYSYNGTTCNKIVKLSSYGVADSTFLANMGTGFDNTVRVMAIDFDGNIIVGGNFNSYNDISCNKILKLSPDGVPDEIFLKNMGGRASSLNGFDNQVNALAIDLAGNIIVGGDFNSYNDISCNNILKLSPDGVPDEIFLNNMGGRANSLNGFDNQVNALAIDLAGNIIVGGEFTSYNNNTINCRRIVKLSSDGVPDKIFLENMGGSTNIFNGFNGSVNALAIDLAGNIIVGGNFYDYNNISCNKILKLRPDGAVDENFLRNSRYGFDSTVYALAIDLADNIIVGGQFNYYNNNTIKCGYILKLNGIEYNQNPNAIAIGQQAGYAQQHANAIAIGTQAGQTGQGANAIAFGFNSGSFQQGTKAIALGYQAGQTNQHANAIAIGKQAGWTGQQVSAVAIGYGAGHHNQGAKAVAIGFQAGKDIQSPTTSGGIDPIFYANMGGAVGGLRDNSDFGIVNSIAIDPAGNIIVGGKFTNYNNNNCKNIMRLLSDGTFDPTFDPNKSAAPNEVKALTIDLNGHIIVGCELANNINPLRILNSDGIVDLFNSFNVETPGFNGKVNALAIDSVGDLIVGGDFTHFTVLGSDYIILALRSKIARIFTNNFQWNYLPFEEGLIKGFENSASGSGSGSVNALAVDFTGNIIVGGNFNSYLGTTSCKNIFSMTPDGSSNLIFNSSMAGLNGINGNVTALAVDTNNNIIVGGTFTSVTISGINEATRNIVRLTQNGAIDRTFLSNMGAGFQHIIGENTIGDVSLNTIAIDYAGNIIVGGRFNRYNNNVCSGIVRLTPDGAFDDYFKGGINGFVNAMAADYAGNIIAGGNFNSYLITTPCNSIVKLVGTGQNQNRQAIAVGANAGNLNQSINAVAIGAYAGNTNQPANSICLNATGAVVPQQIIPSAFYVTPVRQSNNINPSGILEYNSINGEISFNGTVNVTTLQQQIQALATQLNILTNKVNAL
jgi:uncharacterized delta-60 repeat protein